MKLCFIASSNSIHSYKWIKYFCDLNYEVMWISLDSRSVDIPDNANYFEFNIKRKYISLLFTLCKIRNLVTLFNPDILHVHYVGNNALFGLFSNAKCIISTPWGSDIIENKKKFLKKWIISRIFYKSRLITCDAYHMYDEVIKFGVPKEKIHIINFGIDTNQFSKKEKNRKILCDLGVEKELTVISFRNFELVYDVKTLIYAAEIVLKKLPEVQFVIAGRGTLEKKLKYLVKKLNIDSNIIFIGFVENKLLPKLLSSMDIYVSTSLSDSGIASSTAEAMACELPVIITDVAENNKWVDDGRNGFLIPISQPEELAKCLINLLENKEKRNKIGSFGRKKIMDNNNYFIEMNKIDNLYKNILNDKEDTQKNSRTS